MSLVEKLPSGVVVVDQAGVVRYANQAANALFATEPEGLRGRALGHAVAPGATVEVEVRASSGETKELELCGVAVDWEGEACTAIDVRPVNGASATKSSQLEEQLRQAQRMEAVGRLAGGVAHDFNNLLTAIISFAGFIRDDLPVGDARREDIGEVLRAADRASSLTRQLLAFSRRQPVLPEQVDLNSLVLEADRLLRRTLGEDVEVVTLLDEDLWPVFIDPGQFHQVVMNLAVNARDAMPNGGKLVFRTANVTDSKHGPCVLLRVEDTGTGMPEDVKAHVFEPFFTTKEAGEGTGLGLSTVYGVVTQAGGEVAVDSEPGVGTQFEILLPRATGTPDSKTASPELASDLAGTETVLIVEDEALVRRAAKRLLCKYGYHVMEASVPSEAIVLAQEVHVDMVLCDVVMPQMSGPATVAALRGLKPGLPVLFMTGFSGHAAVEEGMADEDGKQLLVKPFTEHGLLTRVRQTLDRAS
jgi:signal transduction histidine kinase